MTSSSRQTMLHITDMSGDIEDVVVRPEASDPTIVIEQDEDFIFLDRDGARALGEFLIEWTKPVPDESPAAALVPIVTCTFCEMPVSTTEVKNCRKPGCPAKEKLK